MDLSFFSFSIDVWLVCRLAGRCGDRWVDEWLVGGRAVGHESSAGPLILENSYANTHGGSNPYILS